MQGGIDKLHGMLCVNRDSVCSCACQLTKHTRPRSARLDGSSVFGAADSTNFERARVCDIF